MISVGDGWMDRWIEYVDRRGKWNIENVGFGGCVGGCICVVTR